MCCGKETYEEVKGGFTRRWVLRAIGVGTGLVALSGLTGCTSLETLSGFKSSQGEASALGLKQGDAFARLDKKLLKELKQQVKDAIQALKKGDNAHAISSARQALERLFKHYNEIGLTKTLEQGAHEGLKAFNGLDQEVIIELK